jgi:hypothetical protein
MIATLWQLLPAWLGSERRARSRIPDGRILRCEIIGLPARTPMQAALRDITEEGVGLLSKAALDVGTFLIVNIEERGGIARRLRARVVHATPQDNDCLLGCALLDRLAAAELSALL